jgi:hypothetical protein
MAKTRARSKRSKATKVINLKKLPKTGGERALKKALQEASSRKIAIIVLNAPFKLQAA